MDQLLVSIITPSYRSSRYIRETIESVKQQDYTQIEHIIIDGNSDDGTVDILKEYPHLIWISETDTGQSQALNKGFRIAKGDIIGWLNADDTYNPGAISTAVRYLTEHPDIDAVYSDFQLMDENNTPGLILKSKPFNLNLLFVENFIRQQTVFIKKHVLEEVGGVDESLHYSMDRELWLRIGSTYKMMYLPNQISANFRICKGTKTFENGPSFHTEWMRIVTRSISEPLYQNVPLAIKSKAIQKAQVRYCVASMERAVKSRGPLLFLKHFFLLLTKNWKYILDYLYQKIRNSNQ